MPSLSAAMMAALPTLRWEPTAKRLRATLGGAPVVDTTEAVLVWEPMRVVPSYAVPRRDLDADLSADAADPPERPSGVLHPGVPFTVHTMAGEPVRVRRGDAIAAGFLPADPELAAYVVLDFPGLTWREEDEEIFGHPHDPFARIDVRRSDRHVRVRLDGVLLAESDRPTLLFETHLPARAYLPKDALRVEVEPGERTSTCAYKGHATYWSVPALGGRDDLLWSYEDPEPEVAAIAGLVCFYNELVDLEVDGRPWGRTSGPIHDAIVDEMSS